jgi:hypothetical protein
MTEPQAGTGQASTASWVGVILAWLVVGIPLLWGVFMTLKKAALLFE